MADQKEVQIIDSLTLRFTGENENGDPLHELKAEHVAEVLQGLVGLTSDFDKAGAFGADGPSGSEVLVRPAKEGSFLIEVVRIVTENWESMAAVGVAAGIPSLSNVIWWATKSARAEVKEFDRLENGNVKVLWQDDTAQEIPAPVWEELQKRKNRRKKQLREIMAPLADSRVEMLDVAGPPIVDEDQPPAPEAFKLTKPDFYAVRLSDEIDESAEFFNTEARLSAIDFDDPTRWKVKTKERKRTATVEDQVFLLKVEKGLAIRKDDIFQLRIREDKVKKNGNTSTKWTVLLVDGPRRAKDDTVTRGLEATS